ncbi:MAG: 16S rRNA (guanine(966)-N(2))-methyltransferase RsmD [Gammaproteobacteria bacterium]|nr:16S rRNA (guanine(966)-N(2))-methyltransferase RsmD [Gammaproteobacteria bacterium]
MARSRAVKPNRKSAGQVRIIGGTHRGRKLPVPDIPGLRPTGDRVRETLFNWLQATLPGARCLDLFAGSGALGLEAASRGAETVLMLDRSDVVVRQLRENVALLGVEQVTVEKGDALSWLAQSGSPNDIVFLDPPFADDLLAECVSLLQNNGWLSANAVIYIERAVKQSEPPLPEEWHLLKSNRTGEVVYTLYRRDEVDKTG